MALDPGYDIVETQEFLEEVERQVSSAERWDEMRGAMDWLLNRNPTSPNYARRVTGNLWYVQLNAARRFLVFYEVRETQRTVTYSLITPDP